MKEYDLYVPLCRNDGAPVSEEKLARLKKELVEQFGGLTNFPQANEGFWKIGSITFRDKIVILRVLADDEKQSAEFFKKLKKEMQREWEQDDVLIVARDVSVL
ncbi:MAG: hypothetical protein QOD99_1172 [Chthoniobacter sp.]|nr:hypothetical protein [Chthoniobacter sp.]